MGTFMRCTCCHDGTARLIHTHRLHEDEACQEWECADCGAWLSRSVPWSERKKQMKETAVGLFHAGMCGGRFDEDPSAKVFRCHLCSAVAVLRVEEVPPVSLPKGRSVKQLRCGCGSPHCTVSLQVSWLKGEDRLDMVLQNGSSFVLDTPVSTDLSRLLEDWRTGKLQGGKP